MAWYSDGTINVTNGSTSVVGVGTNFISGLQAGWGLIGPDGNLYEILTVQSATALTLGSSYLGSTQTGQEYRAFSTQSLAASLTASINQLISNYQGVVDGVGAGKFPKGSAGAPGVRGLTDQDTGLVWNDNNTLGQSVGGTIKALLSSTAYKVDVPITGTAVTQSNTDATAGRLTKVGDFGYGGDAIFVDDPNGIRKGGKYRSFSKAALPTPTGGYVIEHTQYDSTNAQQTATSQGTNNPDVYVRNFNGTSWGAWERLLTIQEVQSSVTDATPLKLMKVGAFGWGRTSTTIELDDLNNLDTPTGTYNTGSGTANTGGLPSDYGVVTVTRWNHNIVHQEWQKNGVAPNAERYFRTYNPNNSTWSDWQRVLSEKNVQNNALDSEDGKLMSVGAFGLGSDVGQYPSSGNANNAVRPGFYCLTSTSTGNPSGGTAALTVTRSYNMVFQVCQHTDTQWTRRSSNDGASWTDWELCFDNNWGVNGNGYWSRLTDGTQICWRTRASVAINNVTSVVWTGSFPATFHSGVVLTASAGGGNSQDNDYGAYMLTTRVSNSAPEIRLRHIRDNARTDTLYFDYVALGRWKA